jgi:hypothetical protein
VGFEALSQGLNSVRTEFAIRNQSEYKIEMWKSVEQGPNRIRSEFDFYVRISN